MVTFAAVGKSNSCVARKATNLMKNTIIGTPDTKNLKCRNLIADYLHSGFGCGTGVLVSPSRARSPNRSYKKKSPVEGTLFYNSAPCYFPTSKRSILTATRLNFCVRYGNRCFPRAMGTDLGICASFPANQQCWLLRKPLGQSRCQLSLRSSLFVR